ncbi:MAG: hypothetical protein EHM25_12115 [Nitrosopumilales archaeon]|nr:MAG: hypothetical protein EHM25_12115 [Nitrosopumilales archaeon]
MAKPVNANSESAKEMEKVEKQFDEFDKQIKDMTHDRMSAAPKQDVEPQNKMSQSDIEKSKDVYLKPKRTISSREKFNEKYRDEYNFQKEYVQFIPEHREIIGESIELWTKPFAGMPAEEWVIPTGKPVWAPRYVAERIKGCNYHRFVMQQNVMTSTTHAGQMYGAMAVDTTVQRLDALPVGTRKSIFMGAGA